MIVHISQRFVLSVQNREYIRNTITVQYILYQEIMLAFQFDYWKS